MIGIVVQNPCITFSTYCVRKEESEGRKRKKGNKREREGGRREEGIKERGSKREKEGVIEEGEKEGGKREKMERAILYVKDQSTFTFSTLHNDWCTTASTGDIISTRA